MNLHLCHDCHKEIGEEETGDLIGAKYYKYQDKDKEYFIIKCDECFAKDPSLRNYKETEVFSRTVGYYRPVQSWHKGKQKEYEERKEFNINDQETGGNRT